MITCVSIYIHIYIHEPMDDGDVVEPKTVQCNNCGVIHKIFDLCKSEIVSGREDCSFVSVEDIKFMIPQQIKEVLETYKCDLPTWEEALFIFQEQKWGSFVILERKENEGDTEGKILRFKGERRFMIEPFIDRRTI